MTKLMSDSVVVSALCNYNSTFISARCLVPKRASINLKSKFASASANTFFVTDSTYFVNIFCTKQGNGRRCSHNLIKRPHIVGVTFYARKSIASQNCQNQNCLFHTCLSVPVLFGVDGRIRTYKSALWASPIPSAVRRLWRRYTMFHSRPHAYYILMRKYCQWTLLPFLSKILSVSGNKLC